MKIHRFGVKYTTSLFKFLLFIALVACSSDPDDGPSSNLFDDWTADVQFLEEQMPLRHVELYHGITEADFSLAIQELRQKIPQLTYNQFVLELMKVVALISSNGRDGHTGLNPLQPVLNYSLIPIVVFNFSDGLFIVNSTHQELIGAKLLAIGDHDIMDIQQDISQYLSKDNDHSLKSISQLAITVSELMHAAGYIDNESRMEISIEKEGNGRETFEIEPVSTQAYFQNFPEIQRLMLPENPAPLYLSNQMENFWYSFQTDSRILYFQYNAVTSSNNDEKTIGEISTEMETFIANNEVDKMIIDMRLNEGGDNTTYAPLLEMLERNELSMQHKLYVIVGRGTFSAGMNFVINLEQRTNAIFVGEPTGGAPNHYGDALELVLPNTGISIGISSVYHGVSGPDDTRLFLTPDISAELSSQGYFNGIDPSFQAILDHQ